MSRQDLLDCIPLELFPHLYLSYWQPGGACLAPPSKQPARSPTGFRPNITFHRLPEQILPSPLFTVGKAAALDLLPLPPPADEALVGFTFGNSGLAAHVIDRLRGSDPEWLPDELKAHLSTRVNSICLYLINHATTTELVDPQDARKFLAGLQASPLSEADTLRVVGEVLLELVYDLRGALLDEALTVSTLEMMVEFIQALFRVVTAVNGCMMQLMQFQLGPPPGHLAETIKKRLVLCALHPAAEEVFRLLMGRGLVRGPRVFKGWLKRPLRPVRLEDWQEILEELPPMEVVGRALGRTAALGACADFTRLVYQEQRPIQAVVLRGDQRDLTHLALPHHPGDAFRQMITLVCPPNWEQLWAGMGWGRSFRVQRRLRYVRGVLRWEPKPIHFLEALFADIPGWNNNARRRQ